MTGQPCTRCDRPVGDARVCSLCGRDAERALGNIPALTTELEVTITRQQRFSSQSDGGRSAETPVPFHVVAGEALDVLRNVLVGWCRMYAEDANGDLPTAPPDDRLVQAAVMSRYLLPRVEWFRHHELAEVFVDEIVTAVGTIGRVIDTPPHKTTFPVGPCPEVDVIGTPCPGEVRAFIPSTDHGMARMACPVCESEWATWQWMKAGKRIKAREAELKPPRATLASVDNRAGT